MILTAVMYLITFITYISSKKEKITKIGSIFFTASFISHAMSILLLILSVVNFKGEQYMGYDTKISFYSNTYEFGLIMFSFIISLLFLILPFVREYLLKKLPDVSTLDDLGYKTILVGFPFMTLLIITGAVWAHYAWGRYWGWDPKETWSLITWFVYAIYLHLRYTRGWQGRWPAALSILGFFCVVFTYLGVNLLLSGLHSYGSG
jgi:cytochrome c-type biogenesis protein CcsB